MYKYHPKPPHSNAAMSYKEIASFLSKEEGKTISEEAVRSIVRRALDKIKIEAIRRELELELLE